jgi:hypothetical protein
MTFITLVELNYTVKAWESLALLTQLEKKGGRDGRCKRKKETQKRKEKTEEA